MKLPDVTFQALPDCGVPFFPVFSDQAVEFAEPPLPSGQ
jgi:hypothetical protein